MKKVLMVAAILVIVPALRAQQADPQNAQPQTPQHEPAAASDSQTQASPAIRPGHPLDPADVDVLTGKKDREIAASRRPSVPVVVGSYGVYGPYGDVYGDLYGMSGRGGLVTELPLTRVSNPNFFFGMQPRVFGRGGIRGRR